MAARRPLMLIIVNYCPQSLSLYGFLGTPFRNEKRSHSTLLAHAVADCGLKTEVADSWTDRVIFFANYFGVWECESPWGRAADEPLFACGALNLVRIIQ